MRKRPLKQKEYIRPHSPRCSLCLSLTPSQLLPLANLKKKYYYPQTQTYHYRTANNFIYDPFSREAIDIAQMHKLINTKESLQQYSTFKETVMKIKKVITERVEGDFYGWVDFRTEHYDITQKYYLRRKVLFQNTKKLQKCLKGNTHRDGAVREYMEKKIKKQLDNQRKVKLTQCDTNSSTIDLQKLTHNLEGMIETIANLSTIKPNLKLNSENNLSLLFKTEGCGISAIKKCQQQFDSPIQPQPYQQTYGLDAIKPKNKSKKGNKMSLRSMQKLNGFEERQPPQTPQPRLFHAGEEYDETERKKTHSKSRGYRLSQGNKMEPMSPGNRSGSLSISKRLGKNSKSKSRRGK